MAYYHKKYNGSGSTGVSMQGQKIYIKNGPEKGDAICLNCKHFKFGYYCDKRKGVAHYRDKKKKCKYFKEKE